MSRRNDEWSNLKVLNSCKFAQSRQFWTCKWGILSSSYCIEYKLHCVCKACTHSPCRYRNRWCTRLDVFSDSQMLFLLYKRKFDLIQSWTLSCQQFQTTDSLPLNTIVFSMFHLLFPCLQHKICLHWEWWLHARWTSAGLQGNLTSSFAFCQLWLFYGLGFRYCIPEKVLR